MLEKYNKKSVIVDIFFQCAKIGVDNWIAKPIKFFKEDLRLAIFLQKLLEAFIVASLCAVATVVVVFVCLVIYCVYSEWQENKQRQKYQKYEGLKDVKKTEDKIENGWDDNTYGN